MGSLSSFCDCPNYQGLTAARVPGGEDPGNRCRVGRIRLNIPTRIEFERQLLKQSLAKRAGESDSDKNQVGIEIEFAARHSFQRGFGPDANAMKPLDVAIFIAGEVRGENAPLSKTAFFMRGLDAQLQRPERPRRCVMPAFRRHGVDL